jgi:2-dehydrotetronate isomerase
MRFSANLGFLWTDRPLPDAIRAAKVAGFDAVECHWPYEISPSEVSAAMAETGLPMLGLNTRRGNLEAGDMGLGALPGREAEARAAIDEALDYARAIGTPNVHVMAGNATGDAAQKTFLENLAYACEKAAAAGTTILIEPLNRHDAPAYFLRTTDQAKHVIGTLAAPNLKLMFDCYHVQRTEGDVATRLAALLPIVGHVQVAAAPDRGTPDHGELHYPFIYEVIERLGYAAPIGAEYKYQGPTDDSLDWLRALRSA